ncbi:hypothetical protein N3K66_003517 [Trichothecium roseum]|uniref:Uncharacterized protein n=1 Tax=Trichothecium roseum TaxID=47278 RepID=A0ACC0V721_9HYPO|nr:hypothetical protein N3K66_003517 [Trichothecium roseum]
MSSPIPSGSPTNTGSPVSNIGTPAPVTNASVGKMNSDNTYLLGRFMDELSPPPGFAPRTLDEASFRAKKYLASLEPNLP